MPLRWERRKKVLEAEGDKRSAELLSEGIKIRIINESEGNLIKVKNEAEARKMQMQLEAEGDAVATERRAQGQAAAISIISKALKESGGIEAARLNVASELMKMYSDIGRMSSKIITYAQI